MPDQPAAAAAAAAPPLPVAPPRGEELREGVFYLLTGLRASLRTRCAVQAERGLGFLLTHVSTPFGGAAGASADDARARWEEAVVALKDLAGVMLSESLRALRAFPRSAGVAEAALAVQWAILDTLGGHEGFFAAGGFTAALDAMRAHAGRAAVGNAAALLIARAISFHDGWSNAGAAAAELAHAGAVGAFARLLRSRHPADPVAIAAVTALCELAFVAPRRDPEQAVRAVVRAANAGPAELADRSMELLEPVVRDIEGCRLAALQEGCAALAVARLRAGIARFVAATAAAPGGGGGEEEAVVAPLLLLDALAGDGGDGVAPALAAAGAYEATVELLLCAAARRSGSAMTAACSLLLAGTESEQGRAHAAAAGCAAALRLAVRAAPQSFRGRRTLEIVCARLGLAAPPATGPGSSGRRRRRAAAETAEERVEGEEHEQQAASAADKRRRRR